MPDWTPLISVTLPNYNYGRFLAEAFESILQQSYGHFEILFVDDGSTDESRDIALTYARRDRRIKPVFFEKNCGALPAHANTWRRVSGELVYQYSSDDSARNPNFFHTCVEAMVASPQAAGAFGTASLISMETGRLIGHMGNAGIVGYIPPLRFLNGFLREGYFVPGISSIWRKQAIDAVGGYDYRLGPQADYFINHAMPCRSGVVFCNTQFAIARVSETRRSFSSNTKPQDEMRRLALFACKMRKLTRELGAFESDWARWRRDQAMGLIYKYGPSALTT